ncbi:hypothetical protein GIS00_02115 [Nakamurella sp. YIM 132087]|uniref:Uncharacterized protein n=1 Tax=Nakamurella alba TaxID=2665158 RepID=A0A7K1FF86_9ACTN|nr:hypothetical protein [Nakamurella alba]MTD12740.1 hypothetical protein [Nakamurella alba]
MIVLVPTVLLGVSATAAAATDGAASTAPAAASLPVGALIWIVLGLVGVIAGLTATRKSRRAGRPSAAAVAEPPATAHPTAQGALATAGSI